MSDTLVSTRPDTPTTRPLTATPVAVPSAPVPPPAASAIRLNVLPWVDPRIAKRGHDPRSLYVEKFWLGILGPSATLLLRRFARGLDERPEGFAVSLVDTSRALGLGEGTGRNSMVMRTIERLCQFGMSRPGPGGTLEVRTHLPPLTPRQVQRLPELIQRAHARELEHLAAERSPRYDDAA